jgi:hypothetical protein
MVNLDKWEEIKFEDIQKGDTVRRIVTDKDGFRMEVRGKAAIYKGDVLGGARWLADTNNNWIIARNSFNSFTALMKLYRLREEFTFPTTIGAVIEGDYKNYSPGNPAKQRFIFDGRNWVRPGGLRDSIPYLTSVFKNFKVLSEGVK